LDKIQSEGVCFINSAFKIPCHIVKNTLLQTAFHWVATKPWISSDQQGNKNKTKNKSSYGKTTFAV